LQARYTACVIRIFCFLAVVLVQFALVLGLSLPAFLQAINTSGGSSSATEAGCMLMPAVQPMACVLNEQTKTSICYTSVT
jgi:hypothetical protein